jgi:prophage maintenance system killer protein
LKGGCDSSKLILSATVEDYSEVQREAKSRMVRRKKPRNLRSREKPPAGKTQSSINGGGEVVLYEEPNGEVRLDVRLEQETVWLTQRQMATLFETTPENVLMHLKNVYGEGELVETGTTKDFLAVRTEGRRRVRRKLKHYNLDAIISVGYRVNSKRGVRFRQWATGVLHEHIVKGYTLNAQRFAERGVEIEQAVGLLARTLTQHALVTDEGRAVLEVVQQYTRAWRLLLQYDENRLPDAPERPVKPTAELTLSDARAAIAELKKSLTERGESSDLFGLERGDQVGGILGAIEQTFDSQPLYPTVQVRAAHLLYFIIKDHPFSDGNKRIGSFLFLLYLQQEGMALRIDGTALTALALLVAESAPASKDLLIRLIVNLLAAD